jgi:hypothetical protein
MSLTKEEAKRLRRDFVPDGERVDIRTLKFRRTGAGEVFQCCAQSGHDVQSGPIYCGDVAEYVALTERGVVGLCQGHARRVREHLNIEGE